LGKKNGLKVSAALIGPSGSSSVNRIGGRFNIGGVRWGRRGNLFVAKEHQKPDEEQDHKRDDDSDDTLSLTTKARLGVFRPASRAIGLNDFHGEYKSIEM